MSSQGSERDWYEAAKRPQEWTLDKRAASRVDLFRQLDYLVSDLGDETLRSNIRRRVSDIRALAATLIPTTSGFPCSACHVVCRTSDELVYHAHYLHDGPEPPVPPHVQAALDAD